jgi:sugar phosphate isomerase/epimerase
LFESRYIYCDAPHVVAVLPRIAELGLGVEILFESSEDLWPEVRWENLLDLADAVADAGIAATVHGPFDNLNLGSRDVHIRRFTVEALSAALEFARMVRSPQVVFHTGYLPQYAPSNRERWLDRFSHGLEEVLDYADDLEIRLAVENTYEPDTSLFEAIFERFSTPVLGMCFDVGHAACFGRVDPALWSRRFADRICHVHLSDNDGRDDLHWGLGQGVVDFRAALSPLARVESSVGITLEVSAEDAQASRDYLNNLLPTMFPQGQT